MERQVIMSRVMEQGDVIIRARHSKRRRAHINPKHIVDLLSAKILFEFR